MLTETFGGRQEELERNGKIKMSDKWDSFFLIFSSPSVMLKGREGGWLRDDGVAVLGRGGVLWSRRWIMFCY